MLREAQVHGQGHRLGQAGGRIVAEVFLGLLGRDPSSYLRHQLDWRPFLPAATAGDFTIGDLILFTGHGLDVIDLPRTPPRADPSLWLSSQGLRARAP